MKQRKLMARKLYAANPGPLIGLGAVLSINLVGLLLIQLFSITQNSALYIGISRFISLLLQPLSIGYMRYVYLLYIGQQPSAKEFFHYCSSLKLAGKAWIIGLIFNAPMWLADWIKYMTKHLHNNGSALNALINILPIVYLLIIAVFYIYTFLSLYIFIGDSEKTIGNIFRESVSSIKGYVPDFIFAALWAILIMVPFIAAGLILYSVFFKYFISINLFMPVCVLIVSLLLGPYIQLVLTGFAADTLGIKKTVGQKNAKKPKPAKTSQK